MIFSDMFEMNIFDGCDWHGHILWRVNNVFSTLINDVLNDTGLYLLPDKTDRKKNCSVVVYGFFRYSDIFDVWTGFVIFLHFFPNYIFSLWSISPMPVVLPCTGSVLGTARRPLDWSVRRIRQRSGSSSRRSPSTAK
jgi:hypothetical protein